MKKALFLCLSLLSILVIEAQEFPVFNQPQQTGRFKGGVRVDRYLSPPNDTFTIAAQNKNYGAIAQIKDTIYVWSPQQQKWVKGGGGAGLSAKDKDKLDSALTEASFKDVYYKTPVCYKDTVIAGDTMLLVGLCDASISDRYIINISASKINALTPNKLAIGDGTGKLASAPHLDWDGRNLALGGAFNTGNLGFKVLGDSEVGGIGWSTLGVDLFATVGTLTLGGTVAIEGFISGGAGARRHIYTDAAGKITPSALFFVGDSTAGFTPVNGTMWNNTVTGKLRAMEGGVRKDVIGGGSTTVSALDDLTDVDVAGASVNSVLAKTASGWEDKPAATVDYTGFVTNDLPVFDGLSQMFKRRHGSLIDTTGFGANPNAPVVFKSKDSDGTYTYGKGTAGNGIPDGDKGDVTVGSSGASINIDNNAVTNAKLAQIPQGFKGRITAGTGSVENLTPAEATSLLNTFTTTAAGLVPAPSTSNTTDFLRRDGAWASPGVGNGTPGADGATWRNGTTAPLNSLGVNNDYYLNTTTGDIYKKLSGAYDLQGNIKGPIGTAGTGFNPRGAWAPNTVYAVNDIITHNGAVLRVWGAHTSPASFVGSYLETWAAAGQAATIGIGSVSTGAAGSSVQVTNSGTTNAAILNFTIPKGDPGNQGQTGSTGATGADATISVGSVSSGTTASVTNVGTPSAGVFNFVLPKGDPGNNGTAATIAVGTVSSLSAGATPTVTNSGNSSAATFNFGIPAGLPGAPGTGFLPRGPWLPNTAYAVNDIVTYGGQTYRVNTAITSPSTFNTAFLELWAAKGADGVAGITLASGDYVGTIAGDLNIAATDENVIGTWSRVGDIVHVSGGFNARAAAAGFLSSVQVSLPVTSDIAASTNITGVFNSDFAGTTGKVLGDVSSNRLIVQFTTSTTQIKYYQFEYSYKVR